MFGFSRTTTAHHMLPLIIWGGLLFTPTFARSEYPPSSSPEAQSIVQRGTIEVGVVTGYLQGVNVASGSSANRSAFYLLPRIGMVVTDHLGSGYLTGNVTLMFEPLIASYVRPFGASAVGGALLVKYNFLSFGRWLPYWDVGGGMLWTDLAPRIAEQSTPVNFLLETGPGLQYLATDRIALTVGTRFHHISNGNTGDRNDGLNSILTYVGMAFFFPH
ncbi:MAG: acyloxyacyl hydrolase [Nitrospirota bacterium]|nr:acyloxyacyl hydrolase [Nitrospirota bacterium]